MSVDIFVFNCIIINGNCKLYYWLSFASYVCSQIMTSAIHSRGFLCLRQQTTTVATFFTPQDSNEQDIILFIDDVNIVIDIVGYVCFFLFPFGGTFRIDCHHK